MTTLYELEGPPDNKSVRIESIQLIELDQSKSEVKYSTPAGYTTIKYASGAEATTAYETVRDLINNPGALVGINALDPVRISHNDHAKGALAEEFEAVVLAVPQPLFPYWIVQTESAIMVCENVTVSKRT